MRASQLLPSVRREVEKPFQEKLARARQLVKLWADKNACVSCSFGKDSTVVLYLVREVNPHIPVIFNNTGVEYPETLKFKELLKREWNLNLIETKPIMSYWQVIKYVKEKGLRLDDGKKYFNVCCRYLKKVPFKKAVKAHGFKIVFTGLTAMESRLRMWSACERGMEYYSRTENITRVHPILYWTPEEVWDFIHKVQIPVNPAYEKYKLDRIGCVPCTSHRHWREQMARVNPKMYKFVSEEYFGQKLLM